MEMFGHRVGRDRPLFLIAGPCVLESKELALTVAAELRRIADRHAMLVIFKGSYDKANRTGATAYRGPGLDRGLAILDAVRRDTGLPTLTDVHTVAEVAPAAAAVDALQTPAFLARQTDLIVAAAASGRPVNIKKAQYMAPEDMAHVLAKARAAAGGVDRFLLCERGTSFGYRNLVNDMRALEVMAETGAPVVFDATHSVQLPGAGDGRSGGERRFVPVLARAAIGAGVAGLFVETHPDPDHALSDGANAWPLDLLAPLVDRLVALDRHVKEEGFGAM